MKNFKYWDNLHRNENLEEFSNDRIGLLWLKIKSIIRKELIEEFVLQNKILLKETALKSQFVELFDLLVQDIDRSHKLLGHTYWMNCLSNTHSTRKRRMCISV